MMGGFAPTHPPVTIARRNSWSGRSSITIQIWHHEGWTRIRQKQCLNGCFRLLAPGSETVTAIQKVIKALRRLCSLLLDPREERLYPDPPYSGSTIMPQLPQANTLHDAPKPAAQPRRLILCFDGTGNQYMGTEEDTNIVKIYEALERHIPGQYAYYQPGIGTLTYVRGSSRQTSGFSVWARFKARISALLDQGIGVSFVSHLIAGYKFVMRYYSSGDHIYIFGFSRGAYTARFLAEMIHNIGLLSRGNEEMVPFAWDTFSRYQSSRGNVPQTDEDRELARYMKKFKTTFCRPDVGVHFLGLFDCVNSVGQFEIPFFRKSYRYIASPSARHIRHAVSIHERRLKFKPALFHIDEKDKDKVELKEVWFAGNHGDVGGGWPLAKGQKSLLSDIALDWMIQEVLNLPDSKSKLQFMTTNVKTMTRHATSSLCREETPGTEEYKKQQKLNRPHDKLSFGKGGSAFSVVLWWILEVLPFATRLELEKGKWVPRRFPPNFGASRDIPCGATIHPSVYEMLDSGILDDFPVPRPGGDNPNLPPALINAVNGERRHIQAEDDQACGCKQSEN